jgi:uncharacterized protein YlxP (DUF503 family)
VFVGVLELDLRLEGCRSLKEKRHVIRSTLDRLIRNLHVSAAEIGDHDLWGNAVLGVSVVSANQVVCESVLAKALSLIDEYAEVEVAGAVQEVLRFP